MSEQGVDRQIAWRLDRLERTVDRMETDVDARFDSMARKIDRLVLALALTALSVSGSVIVFALTILLVRP